MKNLSKERLIDLLKVITLTKSSAKEEVGESRRANQGRR